MAKSKKVAKPSGKTYLLHIEPKQDLSLLNPKAKRTFFLMGVYVPDGAQPARLTPRLHLPILAGRIKGVSEKAMQGMMERRISAHLLRGDAVIVSLWQIIGFREIGRVGDRQHHFEPIMGFDAYKYTKLGGKAQRKHKVPSWPRIATRYAKETGEERAWVAAGPGGTLHRALSVLYAFNISAV